MCVYVDDGRFDRSGVAYSQLSKEAYILLEVLLVADDMRMHRNSLAP